MLYAIATLDGQAHLQFLAANGKDLMLLVSGHRA